MPGAFPGQPQTPWARLRAGHHETPANALHKAISMIRSSKRHLSEVDETYFEHMAAALAFSTALAKAAGACALHAVIPGLCTRSASRCIANLHSTLVKRGVLPASTPRDAPPACTQAHERSDDHRLRLDA